MLKVFLTKCTYGVATRSRLLEIIGLFCRISSLLQGSFAKETLDFKEPTNRSNPIVKTASRVQQIIGLHHMLEGSFYYTNAQANAYKIIGLSCRIHCRSVLQNVGRLFLLYAFACAFAVLGWLVMGWLRLVGCLKIYVSLQNIGLFCRSLLQKRPIFLSILLIVATP